MTATPLRASRPRDAASCDGAVLVLGLDDPSWAERLPPVPATQTATVSFSTEAAAGEHADALEPLGYTVVGVWPGEGEPSAAIHVSEALLRAHPVWWRTIAASADRAYNLAAGPVVRRLAGLLDLHAGVARPSPPATSGEGASKGIS